MPRAHISRSDVAACPEPTPLSRDRERKYDERRGAMMNGTVGWQGPAAVCRAWTLLITFGR
jgi:hypothetical protein